MREKSFIWGVFLALALTVLAASLDLSILGPALPGVAISFNLTNQALTWIFTVYTLSNLLTLPMASFLADWIGKKTVLVISTILFILGSILSVIASNLYLLILARILLGAAASGVFPVVPSILAEFVQPERRGKMLGMLGAVFGISMVAGPVIATLMLPHLSWRSLFILTSMLGTAALVFILIQIPQDKGGQKSRFPFSSLLILMFALIPLVLLLSGTQISTELDTNLQYIAYAMLTLIMGMFFVVMERKALHPLISKTLLRKPLFRYVFALAVMTGIAQACYIYIPKLITFSLGVTDHKASGLLIPVVVVFTLSNYISGRYTDRLGPFRVLRTGWILLILALGLLGTLKVLHLYYLAAIFFGAGLATMESPSLRYILLQATGVDERTRAQGLLSVFISFGQLTGSAFIGGISALSHDQSIQTSYLFMIPFGVAAFIITLATRRFYKV